MHEVSLGDTGLADAVRNAAHSAVPAVIRLGHDSPFVRSFSPAILARDYGSVPVHAEERSTGTWHGTLSELLDQLDDQPGNYLYMKHVTLHDLDPGLVSHIPKEVRALNWLSALPSEMRPSWYWLLAGQAGTRTPLHVDTMASAAWNLLIDGVKQWRFLPPSLAVERGMLPIAPEGLYDPEPVGFEQQPGDLIFTPSGWAHAVLNPSAAVAVTGNFIGHANIDFAISYFESVGEKDNASLLRDVRHAFAKQGDR